MALRHQVDVLQIATYYSPVCRRRPSSASDGGEKSAYREEKNRERREAMMDLGGLGEGGAAQDPRFQEEQWGLFSPVICAAISCFLQLPSPRELLRWNLNMRRRAAGTQSELAA